MEDVLDVYHRPYTSDYPVVCMDESSKQLIGEVRTPISCAPGHPELVEDEYIRHGVAEIFMAVEPLAGRRHVAITEHRTRVDWANFVKGMLEDHYPTAKKVALVMDNLNTHSIASLYQAFSPEVARRLANRLEIHHTPKHGSWLNIAEIELSALKRQCLADRIPTFELMAAATAAWEHDRNNRGAKVKWQFSTDDARIKLRRLYPNV
ncbi:transposase [Betaproteobacteria bacterium]|nr:transposase [Betaproteobacteria bacterium]